MTENEQRQIFGDNLNYFIAKSNKNQVEISDDLDVPRTTVNTWCAGRAIPGMPMLKKLMAYFHCTLSDLVDKHESYYEELHGLTMIIEENKNEQFLKRMLAYAKLLSENPEA